MLLNNLPEESNSPNHRKLYDIFSPDIDTREKLILNSKTIKESSKLTELFTSPNKSEKEISLENDDLYSPYVKRTISNVIKNSVKSKFSNNANNYLTTYKKIYQKNFTRLPQI